MADYQNLFTRVQIIGPAQHGVPLPHGNSPRTGQPQQWWLLGLIGNAQLGPVYLGSLGLASLILGTLSINIMGFNMLAQVNWDIIEFVRQLPWLALEPPKPEYGLRLPPMNEGGWWLLSGGLLTTSILLWWLRTYTRARALGLGTHVAWAFASAIWLFLVLGFFRPLADGQLGRGCAFRHLPAPGLDGRVLAALRQPVLQPLPRPVDRLPVRRDAAVRDARRHHPGRQPLRR
jgi:photosynthetic reaction center M subunit